MAIKPVRAHIGIRTTIGMLNESVRKFPDRPALRIFRNGSYDEILYRDYMDKVNRFAAALMNLHIEPGDRVSILGENRPEWAIAYMAVHRAGCVGVPLDALAKPGELVHVLRDSGAVAVVTSAKFLPDVLEMADTLDRQIIVICMDDEIRDDVMLMSEMIADSPLPPAFPEVDLDDTAVLIYTSGTTGRSKGVVLTHRNLGSDVAGIYEALDYDETDVLLSLLPLHHTFEATVGFLSATYAGSSTTYARSLKSRDIIDDIRNTGATIMLGVPLLYEKIMEGMQRKIAASPLVSRMLVKALFSAESLGRRVGINLRRPLFGSIRKKAGMETMRVMSCGGAAMPARVGNWFHSLGFDILQGYGLTETSPVLSMNRVGHVNHASVGPPLSSAKIKIASSDPSQDGEILARGPMVMRGYYNNPKATEEAIDAEGWFHTGDVGHFDKQGRLYVTGRKKDVIVTTNGKNVYPEEVEGHINRIPWVLESLVLGKPIPDTTSEVVHATIVPSQEYIDEQESVSRKKFTTEEIEATIREALRSAMKSIADYKVPKTFEIRWEEFEKTSTRKIKRFLYKMKQVTS